MSEKVKFLVPMLVWLALGLSSIVQGRRQIQVGYEISRLKSEITRVEEENVQLAYQGYKLRSPKRLVGIASELGLSLTNESTSRTSPRPGPAPSAGHPGR